MLRNLLTVRHTTSQQEETMIVEVHVSSKQLVDLARVFARREEAALAGNLLKAADKLEKWEAAAVQGGATEPIQGEKTLPSPLAHPIPRTYDPSWFYWVEDGSERTLIMRIPPGGERKRVGRGYAREGVVQGVVEELARRAERNGNPDDAVTFSARELANALGMDMPNAEAQVRVAVRYLQSHGVVDKRPIRRGGRPYRLASRSIAGAGAELLPSPEEIGSPGLKTLLAAAPLEGIDIERRRDLGRETAL